MAILFEDLKVLQSAEMIGDMLWKQIVSWELFARDTVGKQLTRAADSVGANIAEAYGRYHYGEKLQFLYYARGSLFETKYWLNRARKRNLVTEKQADTYGISLSQLALQINTFSKMIKAQRSYKQKSSEKLLRESQPSYQTEETEPFLSYLDDETLELFTTEEIESLKFYPQQSPSNTIP